MSYEIRAMSFAEILDTGLRLVRDHFTLLVGIGLALYGPLAILGELMGGFGAPGQIDPGTAISALLLSVLVLALSPIAQGAMTLAIGDVYRGRTMRLGEAYRGALHRMLALAGTYLLAGLGILIGILLLVIPGIYLMIAWTLVTPIVMLEGIAGPSALSRSRDLLKDHMLRAFGILAVATIIMIVLTSVLQLLLSGIPIVGAVASAIAQSITMAFLAGVTVVLYFDLRCRKENFDLEHLAQLVEGRGAPARSIA